MSRVAELSLPVVSADATNVRPSAVLIVLADGPNGAEVLLTRRSMSVSSHRGDVCFPGGRLDAGEDSLTAALREAHEEVGLASDLVTVAGELYPIGTYVSRSWIVPIVGHIAEPQALQACTTEVDRVFWVSLADLTQPGAFREEWWPLPFSEPAGERPIYFFDVEGETVWGATARMLHQLLRVAHRIEGDEPPAI
ncbi:MAG: CoA pyrophosphatase [Actinomycetia bacterium]|nr:CoA pyrophosphatase [Actinomycetes bacterium]